MDMTDNEMAKLHVRYMVGGHARGIENEVLYRFEFPERPGALLKFLHAVGPRWNISLFHYRKPWLRIMGGCSPESRCRRRERP